MELPELSLQTILLYFAGGLGIFLFGLFYLIEVLQKQAGYRLRHILDRVTDHPLKGILAGMLLTIAIQSSSGTTVITVGLVSAGLLSFRQAIAVVLGANIGTTMTAFLIGIDLGEYSLGLIAIGTIALILNKKNVIGTWGKVAFSIGALFYGLELMGNSLEPVATFGRFTFFLENGMNQTFFGVVIGAVFTAILQSSSATIGILQEAYAARIVNIENALPILLGDNVGTTITAVLASIGASLKAKRVALFHVWFNIFGTCLFLLLFPVYLHVVSLAADVWNLNARMTIAFAHGIFNVTNVLLHIPFIGLIVYTVEKVFGKLEENKKTLEMDTLFIEQSPSIALGQAKNECVRMGSLSLQSLQTAREYFDTNSPKLADSVARMEEQINELDKKISDYLFMCSTVPLSLNESEKHSYLLESIRDFERIGDHVENIIELIDETQNSRLGLTPAAKEELENMFTQAIANVQNALYAFDFHDKQKARLVLEGEDKLDLMERKYRKGHIIRMNRGECNGQAGIVFVDMLNNLERIGDHSANIAEGVLQSKHL
ncbi:Na/Pi cotransporter family protein [Mangrovibacillus cuniculi]|uniref:Na/Pi cotransporter family protein n=1 Tax=Mangrovibacillus cuniculi TaxID=2593652 RepID=A0A7S8CBG1_9BACI|nr:Na/Pi cotransporter family protein [Mangrovibacillus cuniculi]QPC46891.1 Na/Pi cotransporter family protein [Mangrovibacillus cuniculi]